MPTPTTASLLLTNSRSASRHPLWTAPTSPPSAARLVSSGGSDACLPSATICLLAAGRSGQPDARVRDGQRDIRDEVAQNYEDGNDQRVGQQHRVILLAEAVEEQQAEARVVEQGLGDQVPGQQGGEEQPDQGDHRQ